MDTQTETTQQFIHNTLVIACGKQAGFSAQQAPYCFEADKPLNQPGSRAYLAEEKRAAAVNETIATALGMEGELEDPFGYLSPEELAAELSEQGANIIFTDNLEEIVANHVTLESVA